MTKKYEIVGTDEIYEGYIAEGNLCDYLELEDLCDLLNELSENLTGCNKTANNAIDTIKALTEENKKLKSELDNIYLLIGQGNWSGLVDLIMEK